jgi:hypothetical protein
VKNGKRNEKIKKEKDFLPCWAGGISAHPGASAAAAQLAQQRGGNGGGRRCGAGPTRQRGGVNGADRNGGRGRPTGIRPAVEIRGGSPPWVRFRGGEVVLLHGRKQAITGVGPILPAGAYGGRSAARWRVSTTVMSPVRLPGAIGGKGRLVTLSVWRSFEHWLIGLMINRKWERGSPERWGKHGGASLICSGEGRGVGRSWCGEDGARAVPFIGARERERDGGDDERRRARHDGENGANGDWDGSGRRGVRGRLGHSGRVVAEAGASLNGEATGREALGGECAGEAWARTTELTGGPELSGRGSGARGRESGR